MTTSDAKQSGVFAIGGSLKVNRLGFGAMRITGRGFGANRPIAPRLCAC